MNTRQCSVQIDKAGYITIISGILVAKQRPGKAGREWGRTMPENGKHCRIFLDADEYAEIERIAARRNMSVEEWIAEQVRQTRADYHKHIGRIQEAIDAAAQRQYPMDIIEQMLQEIHDARDRGRNARNQETLPDISER